MLAATASGAVQAQDASPIPALREVTVSTPRGELRPFEVPGSVDRVEGSEMREARLQVNLSESLGPVPGLQVQNRQNYAQDLQLSIRGFGARSTFGVRGVRLYVDGIPATLPDGQGQTSNIDIGSADRVEILRGPFSALYGNSSGGVVQVFTEQGEGQPTLGFSVAGGSFGTWRVGSKLTGASGAVDYTLSASRFHTDGWRAHSAADREIQNGRLGLRLDDGSKLSLVFNSVHLFAQDPLGLSAEQYALNPRGAELAAQFDTRKTVDQQQLGLTYERSIDARNTLRLMVYGGQRSTVQYQSIPPAAQANPLHAGGVIDLARDYGGLDLRWSARLALADRPFDLVTGLAYDSLRERRRGFENFYGSTAAPRALGVQGRLRRDERNEVRNLDPYVQGSWRFADRWTLEAGVRRSAVRFSSHDRYIVGPNRDDSGSARYRKTLPVASLRFQATRDLALYASAGRGFETPTLNELSYRADGIGGLNFGLQPSVNTSVEVGAKARVAGGLLTAALFQTRTRDEIVTNTNIGGRATFQNAGRTRRDGFELSWQHETAGYWRTQLAYTWLDARYRDTFCAPLPCSAGSTVPAGNRIPGIAEHAFYASYGWVPPEGWRAGAELRALSRIAANDRNNARAPGYAVASLYAGYVRRWERWDFNAFVRVDNLFDRRYVGSVIVNEGNARYFEPALGRNWTLGVGAAYRF
ncbi:TonB-dependent receptor family protein [Variovorax defluvii]